MIVASIPILQLGLALFDVYRLVSDGFIFIRPFPEVFVALSYVMFYPTWWYYARRGPELFRSLSCLVLHRLEK